ncbi:MAG: hypothetical protein LBT44_00675 [Clostridiales bacterium]|nr:hypothetical protein [Clostridiales bacterium]
MASFYYNTLKDIPEAFRKHEKTHQAPAPQSALDDLFMLFVIILLFGRQDC